MTKAPGWKLRAAMAFAAVYLVWGSTYLAIRVGVQELPPALFAELQGLATKYQVDQVLAPLTTPHVP